MCSTARKTGAVDAAHCKGLGTQSYGTTFEAILYDTNNNLVPILFAHHVGSECGDIWRTVFKAMKCIDGFDVPDRVTVVDQEKSIDAEYKTVFEHAKHFLDVLHVKKI